MFIIILIAIFVSLSLAYNKLNRGSTPRYHVSCKDLGDYWNRIGRLKSDCRNRMDISKETLHRGAAGYRDIWYLSHGSDYLFQVLDRNDYPEFDIIKKQERWCRKEFHKTCRERGIDAIKGEHHDKPHI